MKRRSLLLAPILVGLLVTLTACSPPHIGTLGIARVNDGSLQVLVRICRESTDHLRLQPINSFPHAANSEPENDTWESVPIQTATLSPAVTSASDIPLPFDEQSVEDTVLYQLMASGSGGNAFSAAFSASDLAAIEPGKVLTPATGDQTSDPTLTPQQFEEYAKEFCA